MLDPQLLRNQLDQVIIQLSRRGLIFDKQQFIDLETRRKHYQIEVERLQNQRNQYTKTIGQAKKNGEPVDALLATVSELGEQLTTLNQQLATIQDQLTTILMGLPNLPHESVPTGKNEAENVEVRRWKEPHTYPFTPKDHVDLGAEGHLLDFEVAAKITGSRFAVLRGPIARLHRALIQFMLDLHTQEHGYLEVNVPYLVNADSLRGTGQLPKFVEDLFHITTQDYYLIPTAEVPVTNLARDTIWSEAELPARFVAHTSSVSGRK